MADSGSGEKDKLTIATCKVDDAGNITVEDNSFKFMLNPSEYDHSFAIGYNKKEAIGQSGSDVKFSGIKPEKLKFSVVIDGTGALGSEASKDDVKTQLKNIKGIVYKYDGEKHETSHVRVLWGSQIFYGRLESMTVDSKLFKHSGEPLRSKSWA